MMFFYLKQFYMRKPFSKIITLIALSSFCLVSLFNFSILSTRAQNTTKGDSAVLYGFNTQLSISSDLMTLDLFKTAIDDLVALNISQPTIRVQMDPDSTFPRTNLNSSDIDCSLSSPINCNPAALDLYKQALQYANDNGVETLLIITVPYWAKYFSEADEVFETKYNFRDYKSITRDFINTIFNELEDIVTIWQIFNEANRHAFDSYDLIDISNRNYWRKLKRTMKYIARYINRKYPSANLTLNAGTFPTKGDNYNQTIRKLNRYFRNISTRYDSISLDVYPDTDPFTLALFSDLIGSYKKMYQKPVYITETGMCTGDGRFNETDQANYLPQYLDQFTSAGADAVILYQYQDNPELFGGVCEHSFGLKTRLGVDKPAYQAVSNYFLD